MRGRKAKRRLVIAGTVLGCSLPSPGAGYPRGKLGPKDNSMCVPSVWKHGAKPLDRPASGFRGEYWGKSEPLPPPLCETPCGMFFWPGHDRWKMQSSRWARYLCCDRLVCSCWHARRWPLQVLPLIRHQLTKVNSSRYFSHPRTSEGGKMERAAL